jgi:hypothetical protein
LLDNKERNCESVFEIFIALNIARHKFLCFLFHCGFMNNFHSLNSRQSWHDRNRESAQQGEVCAKESKWRSSSFPMVHELRMSRHFGRELYKTASPKWTITYIKDAFLLPHVWRDAKILI